MRSTEISISGLERRKSNQLDRTWYSVSCILPVFLRFSTKQYLAECSDLSIIFTGLLDSLVWVSSMVNWT